MARALRSAQRGLPVDDLPTEAARTAGWPIWGIASVSSRLLDYRLVHGAQA